MTKQNKKNLLYSLLIFFISQIFIYFFIFLFPEYFYEVGLIIGLTLSPIIAVLIGSFLFLIAKSNEWVDKKTVKRGILVIFLFTDIVILTNFFHLNYFLDSGQLFYARSRYNNANVQYIKMNNPKIGPIIQKELPEKWKLWEVEHNTNTDLYWFSALEPSFLHGSIRHIGAFREGQGIITMISTHEVWQQVKQIYGLPSFEQFTVEAGRREITFSISDKPYYATLILEKDHIEVRKGESPKK